jgi:hypothetical protein
MGQVLLEDETSKEVLRRTTIVHHFFAQSSRTSSLAVSAGISLKKASRSETDLATIAADIFEADSDVVWDGWLE